MNCTFFGHKDAPDELKKDLKKTILFLKQQYDIQYFYIGNQGHFDCLVQEVLSEMKVNYSIVISSLNEYVNPNDRDKTLYPEGLEKGLPRFAICRRNDWMIKNSDIAIVYMKYRPSNCATWVEKAQKKGLLIINLAD